MKKLMFSALACVAFAFSGFASNEVVNEEFLINETEIIKNTDSSIETKDEYAIEPYSITINFRNEKGEIVRTKTYPKVDYRPFKGCAEAGAHLAKLLNGVVVKS